MATVAEIPTRPGRPFIEVISWQNVAYTLYFKWNRPAQCWVLDIWDNATTTPLLNGLALVTGCDVLGQFGYLPLAAQTVITVITIGPAVSPDSVPNFDNLGVDGHVYLVMP